MSRQRPSVPLIHHSLHSPCQSTGALCSAVGPIISNRIMNCPSPTMMISQLNQAREWRYEKHRPLQTWPRQRSGNRNESKNKFCNTAVSQPMISNWVVMTRLQEVCPHPGELVQEVRAGHIEGVAIHLGGRLTHSHHRCCKKGVIKKVTLPFLFQLFYAPVVSKLYRFVTIPPNFSNTFYHKNINYPSLSISHAPWELLKLFFIKLK